VPCQHYLRLSPLQPTILHDLAMHIDLAKFVIDTDGILRIPTHVSLGLSWLDTVFRDSPPGLLVPQDPVSMLVWILSQRLTTRDRMQEMTDYHILIMLPDGYTLRDSGYARLMICHYANLLHGRQST
jgi:hypothetical protein